MSAFDRSLLALYAIIVGLLSLFVLFLSLAGNIPYYLQLAFKSPDQRMVIGVLAVVFFIISIRMLFSTISKGSVEQALIQDGALGQVRITLEALENLVKKVAFQVAGVREAQPKIVVTPEGMKLLMKVAVTPDLSIPDTSQELQAKVKEELKQVAGIELNEVRILVHNISTGMKPRVE